MKKRQKIFTARALANLLTVLAGVAFYIVLSNFGLVKTAVGGFFKILSPFLIALGLAYLLNIPMRYFENKIYYTFRLKRGLSVFTVFVLAIVVLVLLLWMILPQLAQSIATLFGNIPLYLENLRGMGNWLVQNIGLDQDTVDFVLGSYSDLTTQLTNLVRDRWPELLNLTLQVGQNMVSGLVSLLTAIIASIYMLLGRDRFVAQLKRTVAALLPQKAAEETLRIGHLSNSVFSGFISGKVLDSAIIGAICYVAMSLIDLFLVPMPFAMLISIIVGVTNIIPFFGPFLGAIPSILLLLLVNPPSAAWFTVLIILLQQFDGNVLGPKILGDSTGLPPLWVLIAIIVGGGLFGFIGMLLGVPTAAVAYSLASDFIAHRLRKKNLPQSGIPPDADTAPPGTASPDADSAI